MFGPSEDEATKAFVAGNPLNCQICGCDRFWHRKAQLNTAVTTFFSLDWLDPSAVCYICESCGYVHWFLKKRES